MSLRVLVADDTIVFRRTVADALAFTPGVEVVGTAVNGKDALAKIESLKPDLVSLDIEMPEMSGIQVLEEIKKRQIEVGVIVLSALSVEGGSLTLQALQLGAFDFITKPSGGTPDENKQKLFNELQPRINAFRTLWELKKNKGKAQPSPLASVSSITPRPSHKKAELVLIGISTGGPNALGEMLPQIPADIGVPILIVQHMPPLFTQVLAESLSKKCKIKVKEAAQGDIIQPGTAYLAPGGKQMKLTKGVGSEKVIQITDDPPENNCKPAVDYLFRSVANQFAATLGGKMVGVIMTGMGNDGTVGLKLLKRQGCFIVAQDEASCVVFGMPKEAIAAGVVDTITSLDKIAAEVVKAVKGSA